MHAHEQRTPRTEGQRPDRTRRAVGALPQAPALPATHLRAPAPDALAGALARAVLQRVGERKAGYAVADDKDTTTGELLAAAFAELRQSRREAKSLFEKEKLAKLATEHDVKARREILEQYVKLLRLDDWSKLLVATKPFVEGKLVLKEDGSIVDSSGKKVVATLTRGDAMYEEVGDTAEARKLYKKKAKPGDGTYVRDNRSTMTRRFAYVEKSNSQFLDFVQTGVMTGRYQRLRAFMGTPVTKVRTIPGKLFQNVFGGRGKPPASVAISEAQLAALNQFKGSGLDQRGLSLTSTPRKGAIFGNAGESFRRDDGVGMRVDLAKVPADVILVNHYAEGGAKDDVKKVGKDYKYVESATKNRELYLEKLSPAWVAGVVVHPDEVEKTGATGEELVKAAAEKLLAASYLAGYRDALKTPAPPVADPSAGYATGRAVGAAYVNGYADGDQPTNKGLETEELQKKMNIQYSELGDTRMGGHADEYWAGWVHGALGQARGAHLPSI